MCIRDRVYSLAMAGAGANAGTIYGASDNSAAYPASNPHDPKDFVATLYHLLGVPPETTVTDATGRPHHVIIGQPIWPLVGEGAWFRVSVRGATSASSCGMSNCSSNPKQNSSGARLTPSFDSITCFRLL